MRGLADWNPVKFDGRDDTAPRERAVDTFLKAVNCRVFVGNVIAAAPRSR